MYCDIFRGINYKSYFTLCWNVLIDNSYISVYCADSQSLVIRYHYVDKVLDKYYFLFSRKTHESRYIFIIVCLFVCLFVNLFLFLLTFLNVINHMDYTVTYVLSIPSTERRTRVRSELLNVSLTSPRVKFYTALPVSLTVLKLQH